MTIPEASGNLLQADTPLDATAHLVYGAGDLDTALRLHAGFDPWFMASMLHANYLHGIQNETKPSADMVAAAADPDRVPCVVEPSSDREPLIDKRKFVVPIDLSASNLLHVVRKRVRLGAGTALFLFTDSQCLVPMSSSAGALYHEYKNKDDNFLYLRYALENAFGGDHLQRAVPLHRHGEVSNDTSACANGLSLVSETQTA